MIALDFKTGTRETSTLPLSDPESGVSLYDGESLVTLTLRWPDDPAVAKERSTWLAVMANVERMLYEPDTTTLRADLPAEQVGALLAERESAMAAWAAAMVAGWSVADVDCTRDAVLSLFARAPFVLELIVAAAGDSDRFLPASLRRAASVSVPPSEAPV